MELTSVNATVDLPPTPFHLCKIIQSHFYCVKIYTWASRHTSRVCWRHHQRLYKAELCTDGVIALILWISVSGRQARRAKSGRLPCGVNEEMVKYILEKTCEQYKYISLRGKTINACQVCLGCAKDNVCVLQDNWAEIRDLIFEADALDLRGTKLLWNY